MPNKGDSLESLAKKVLWEFGRTFARTFGHALGLLAISVLAGELASCNIHLPWPLTGRQ